MSAFIVSRNEIAYLVKAASGGIPKLGGFNFYWASSPNMAGARTKPSIDPKLCGQMLWNENIKSVSARFPNEGVDTLPGPIGEDYRFMAIDCDRYGFEDFLKLGQVAKSLDCYEYQSCEHDGWKDSQAHAFCEALRNLLLTRLPGFEEAEWGAPEPARLAKLREVFG